MNKTGTQRLRAAVGSADSRIPPITVVATSLSGAAASIALVKGDRQTTAAGAALPKDLVVRALDANGNGAADVTLMLSLSGGTVPDTELVTDSLGFATTRWTVGHSAGDYTLAVHVDGIKQLLKLSARAKPAAPANLSFDDAPIAGASKGTRASRTPRM